MRVAAQCGEGGGTRNPQRACLRMFACLCCRCMHASVRRFRLLFYTRPWACLDGCFPCLACCCGPSQFPSKLRAEPHHALPAHSSTTPAHPLHTTRALHPPLAPAQLPLRRRSTLRRRRAMTARSLTRAQRSGTPAKWAPSAAWPCTASRCGKEPAAGVATSRRLGGRAALTGAQVRICL